MKHRGGRLSVAILAAAAVLGMLGTPLQGKEEEDTSKDFRARLTSLKPAKVERGGGVLYSNLEGYGIYFIGDGKPTEPAYIVISKPATAQADANTMREVADHFQRAYKFNASDAAILQDGSGAILTRSGSGRYEAPRNQQAEYSLVNPNVLAPAVKWLNGAFGSYPQRMEGSRLVWRKTTTLDDNEHEVEVALDLLRGAPCCVDVHMDGSNSVALKVLASLLDVKLGPPPRVKAPVWKRELQATPVGATEARVAVSGKKRRTATLCLIRTGRTVGYYRLGEIGALGKVRHLTDEPLSAKMTQPEAMTWVDAIPTGGSATPNSNVWDGLNGGQDIDLESLEEGDEAEESTASASATSPAAMPTPAEAREAYSQLLKSL